MSSYSAKDKKPCHKILEKYYTWHKLKGMYTLKPHTYSSPQNFHLHLASGNELRESVEQGRTGLGSREEIAPWAALMSCKKKNKGCTASAGKLSGGEPAGSHREDLPL